jgi:hypothetical protein
VSKTSHWLLLRNHDQPRAAAVLLALALPSMLVIPDLVGHNSLGLLPLFLAWGMTGFQLWHEGRPGAPQEDGTPTSRLKVGKTR